MNKEPESFEQSESLKQKTQDCIDLCSKECKKSVSITIPVRIMSEANLQEHWTKKHKRKKAIQSAIKYYWNSSDMPSISLPVTITFTRLAPRTLDDDNNVFAFKAARDTISDLFIPNLAPGRADDSSELKFKYAQQKSKEYGFKIDAQEF